MRFEELLIEGGNTSDATNMEIVIVKLWNTESVPTRFSHLIEASQKAVDYLRTQGVSGKAKHLGAGNASISKNWRKWGGTDNTPKTDFVIGTNRISLKKTGGSQLMSAGKGESHATFMAAVERSGISRNELVDELERQINSMVSLQSPEGGVRDTRKAKDTPSGITIIDTDKVHKNIQKHFKSIFNSNDIFKQSMVHEAMTGDVKFGSGSDARAKRVFVYDPKGINYKWDDTDDSAFLSGKAKRTKIVIGWKSMRIKKTKGYNIWSSFRLTEEMVYDISEAFDVTNKIKRWFKDIWTRIKSFLLKSWDNVFEFFGLIPEVSMSETTF